MYELHNELLNDLILRILENREISRKSLKCLDIMVSCLPKAKFLHFLQETAKKSAVKHYIEKPILFNFTNLPPIFLSKIV